MKNKTKLLIVDDDKSVRSCLKVIFAEDYDVYLAENGAEALVLQKNQKIKIVITDILMPEMDGMELCRQIRVHDSECMIFAMSTITESMAGLEYPDLQFNGYITSPTDMDQIKSTIRNAESNLHFV